VKFTFLVIGAVLLAACGGQQPASGPPASVVTGTVAAGPVSPGALPGAPATAAVRGATVEALRGNQVIATGRTDQAGRFEFRLQPGTYLIRAQSDKYLSKEQSKTVTVSKGQKLTVNLVFDTGIS
jgi:hypothetical protein